MSLLSYTFAALVVGTLLISRITPARYRYLVWLAANLIVCAGKGNSAFMGMTLEVVLCWGAGLWIERCLVTGQRRYGRWILLAMMGIQLGLFVFFHGQWSGFSFFLLIITSYVLDIWRGRIPAERNPMKLASFALFFPQLIQGPITRYRELIHQMESGGAWDWQWFLASLRRILWGLLKKLVLADRLAIFVNAAYGSYREYSGEVLWLAVLFYAIQVYADFSGCMDIVLGVAGLFGIRLKENFRQPYLAGSFGDYWRRWHITMGAWFREYVFYPLAVSGRVITWGQKLGKGWASERVRRMATIVLPLTVTWLCTGFWHGTEGHYLLWGLCNGLLILWEDSRVSAQKKEKSRIWLILRTFSVTSLVRVLARADSIQAALDIYRGLWRFGQGRGILTCGLDGKDLCVAVIGTVLLMGVDLWKEHTGKTPLQDRVWPVRWAVCLFGIGALLIFGMYGPGYDPAEFFYSQF